MRNWGNWILIRRKKRRVHIKPAVVFLNRGVEIPEMHLYLGQSRRFYWDGAPFKWWKFWRWPDTYQIKFNRDGRITVGTDWHVTQKPRTICLMTVLPKELAKLMRPELSPLAKEMMDEVMRRNPFIKFFSSVPGTRFEWHGDKKR